MDTFLHTVLIDHYVHHYTVPGTSICKTFSFVTNLAGESKQNYGFFPPTFNFIYDTLKFSI